jgi:pimeloyl-ACP methyl ester carboxylesterase
MGGETIGPRTTTVAALCIDFSVAGHAFGNRVARTLAADRPDLVHSVILFAAGGKVAPKPQVEAAVATIFNPTATEDQVLDAMKYMVGPADDVQAAWNILKPCRAPAASGIQGLAMKNTALDDWWAPRLRVDRDHPARGWPNSLLIHLRRELLRDPPEQ